MYSNFQAGDKTYRLKVDSFCCNKFGLAEFFVNHLAFVLTRPVSRVLDVGCGVGPLGIYLANQFSCEVIGVELNPIACACCRENLQTFALTKRFLLRQCDFQVFREQEKGRFDLIVSNPPLSNAVSDQTIHRFANYDYTHLDSDSFSYLTNSWHNEEKEDLGDLIFRYARGHLTDEGRVVLVFCLIECQTPNIVLEKATRFGFVCERMVCGFITGTSIGARTIASKRIATYLMSFAVCP